MEVVAQFSGTSEVVRSVLFHGGFCLAGNVNKKSR